MKNIYLIFISILIYSCGDSISPEAYENYRKALINWETPEIRKKAIEYLNKAIEIQPDYFLAYELRARYKESNGDELGALLDYNNAIEIEPHSINVLLRRAQLKVRFEETVDDSIYNSAIIDFNKAVDLALIKYNKLLELNPSYIPYDQKLHKLTPPTSIYNILSNRGKFNLEIGNFNDALADFNSIIKIRGGISIIKPDPEDELTYEDLSYRSIHTFEDEIEGRAFAKIGLGDTLGAMQDYNLLATIKPRDESYYLSRGKLKVELGDYKGALVDLAVSKREPYLIESAYYYGIASKRLGNKKISINSFKQSVDKSEEKISLSYYDYDGATGATLGYPVIEAGLASIEIGDLDTACKWWKDMLYNEKYGLSSQKKIYRGDVYRFEKKLTELVNSKCN